MLIKISLAETIHFVRLKHRTMAVSRKHNSTSDAFFSCLISVLKASCATYLCYDSFDQLAGIDLIIILMDISALIEYPHSVPILLC